MKTSKFKPPFTAKVALHDIIDVDFDPNQLNNPQYLEEIKQQIIKKAISTMIKFCKINDDSQDMYEHDLNMIDKILSENAQIVKVIDSNGEEIYDFEQ